MERTTGIWQLFRALLVIVLAMLWFLFATAIYLQFNIQVQGTVCIAITLISGFVIVYSSRLLIRFLMEKFPD